jgi:hypothetical protein
VRKSVLIIVDADPRGSARVAEGLRVAAGLAAEEGLQVFVCLRGMAQRCLDHPRGEWQEEETILNSLESLRESGVSILKGETPKGPFDLVLLFDA